MGEEKVVITGFGSITSCGLGNKALAQALKTGQTFIDKFSRLGEIKVFSPPEEVKNRARFIQLGLIATREAIAEAQLTQEELKDAALILSSSKGGFESLEGAHRALLSAAPSSVSRDFLLNFLPNMAASVLSNILGIRGPTLGYISACNTGLENILRGVELIKSNRVRVVLAGASEACLTPLIIAGFQKLGVLAKERFSPFDKEREGFFLGEGAGVVVLEKASSALARGAKIQAEVLAGVSLGEAYHITSLSLRKNILTVGLRKILKETQLNPMEVDYINVHGTATPANDLYETEAIKDSFGETAYQIKISATKPYTGHLLGASGVLEVIICLLALKEGFLPQTPNYRVQDPKCDLNYLISGPIFSSIKIALSISLGFGGHTGIIALKKWEKS